jgi:cytochrome c-type biogenesis protein CcmH/NrfG
LGAACALVIGVYAFAAHSDAWELLGLNPAGTYYNLLVRGFQAGQLSLKKEVPPGFAQLTDPYDPTANILYRRGIWRLEDLSYYKGRLYLYFGITPALILFWPFATLTGHYLFHGQAVPIFCAMGFLASMAVLAALWRRYFCDVSLWVVLACTFALGLATGVPVLLPRSSVYEAAISCEYMLTMLALGAIWRALHDAERRWRWVAAASVSYGLAVGARPSLVFGAVILLVPVAQARQEHRSILALLLAATGPIMLIGLGLMLYNALRFDSLLEFGVRYQLGGERQFARQLFSPHYFWFNFRVYFLELARWRSQFPFVGDIAVPPLPVGYGQVETPVGILTNIPFVWLALAAPLAWRGRPGSEASALRWFVVAVTLLFGASALPLLFFFSAIVRYEVEFLPALLLLAVLGILGLERTLVDRPSWRRVARWGWGLLLSFSVAFNLLTCVSACAESHNNLGVVLGQTGNIERAIAQFERALRIKPDYAGAHNNLGNALSQIGQTEQAIAHYQLALAIQPDYDEAHFNLGTTLLRLGRVSEAIGYFEQALRINPDDAGAQYNLGNALLQSGQIETAVAHYEQAVRIDPDYPEALDKLAWLLATHSPAESGDPIRAVALAERVCMLTSNRVASYLDTLAAAYAATGRFDDAVSAAQKAIQLAESATQTQLVSRIEMRLELYRANHAYYQTNDVTDSCDP